MNLEKRYMKYLNKNEGSKSYVIRKSKNDSFW